MIDRETSCLQDIWAKSPSKEGEAGETLEDHTRRVVEALVSLMRLRPTLPTQLGWDSFWHAAYWACCFHDTGKIAAGFQAQLREGGSPWGQRHEVLSLAFLSWLRLPDDQLTWVAAAIASHHRDERVIAERYPLGLDPEDDPVAGIVGEVDLRSVHAMHSWLSRWANDEICRAKLAQFGVRSQVFSPCSQSAEELRVQVHAGLRRYRRLVRRLDRGDAIAPDARLGLQLRGAVVSADRLGSAHARPVKPVALGGVKPVLAALDRSWEELYGHQRGGAAVAGDALLVAPTGSGKTEAAVLWAATDARAPLPRLFYLLPYQASINAMHQRLQGYAPGRVGLQHGRALHALYRGLLERDIEPSRAVAIARRERSLARLNHPPIRVLTPYQLLKACFRLKGYEAILHDLTDACFIVDEIHAYEAGRLAMILGMARYLSQHFGARWFVMSATLPSLLREPLLAAFPGAEWVEAESELFARFRRHALHLLDGDLEDQMGLDAIQVAARSGRVLVCCNTVRKAQRVYKALADMLNKESCDVLLLHSGFNARDRLDREKDVIHRAGASSDGGGKPLVLVATQVVEVSLNLSFDTIFTDPAPLDALIQRFGRVHRLPDGSLRPVHVFRCPADGQHVYDGGIVQRTLEVLALHNGEPIDEAAVSGWLDQVYDGQVAEAWRRDYTLALRDFEAAVLGTLRPFVSSEELEELFYDAFDAVEVVPASLLERYDALAPDSPIEADELLLSVRKYVLARLRSEGRVTRRERDRLLVVDVPYDDKTGLRVNDE